MRRKLEKEKEIVVVETRASNIELFRIILMILLVASHYVHNSGILDQIYLVDSPIWKSILIAIFGCWGKTIINCFIFITGYFMCKKTISLKKWIRLLIEVLFYNIVIYFFFVLMGYRQFSVLEMIYDFLTVKSVQTDFVSCYLIFYLFIPFVNILINNMDKKLHLRLICLLGGVYIILEMLPKIVVRMNYVSWFMFVYLFAAYFRIYKKELTKKRKLWLILSCVLYLLSITSVAVGIYVGRIIDLPLTYYLLEDSNKILAVALAFSSFMLFLNINIKPSKIINGIARTTFGVLLIHANSDTMRRFLWSDLLKCTDYYFTEYFLLHAVICVMGVYLVCVFIDLIRMQFIEKPVLGMISRREAKCACGRK